MDRFQWVRSKAEGKILEVGSASGALFEGTGLDVHYCDINEFPLPNFTVADAHNLPFPDGSFTTVCVCELLEHVRDPLQVLREAARVSSKKVIFTVPFEYLWTADKLPFMPLEDRMKRDGLTKEEEYRQGNPTVTGINSIEEAWHRRWFTRVSLEELLMQLGLPYYIELLEYDGWAFLVGEITKPSPVLEIRKEPVFDRFSWTRSKIEELTRGKPGAQVVDIGCRDCPITKEMTNCTWVDCQSYEEIRPPIPREKFIQANAESLPFKDKQFEVAVATQLLAYPENPVAALKEIKRVANQAIITVRNEKDWDPRYRTSQPTNMRFYTEDMLRQHLKEAEIEDYSFERLDYDGWSFWAIIIGSRVRARFIGGIGGCGGTMLMHWLNSHPNVHSIQETGFIPSYKLYALTPESLGEVKNSIHNNPRSLQTNAEVFNGSRERQILDQLLSELANSLIPDRDGKKIGNFINRVFSELARLNDKAIWVEKTPMNIFFGARLREYFGDEFRMLWAEREPRDNICCIAFSKDWGPNDLFGAMDYWTANTKEALQSISSIPERLCMRVSYEDFVHNQVAVGKKICQFLQIPWHKNLEAPIATDADIGRYKREFALSLPEKVAAPFLVGEITNPLQVAPLKIALLSTPFITVPPRNYGGLERIVADLAHALAQAGHQVTVFAPDGSYVEGCEMVYFGPALEKVQVNWLEAEQKAVNVVADRIMNDGYHIIHGQNWFGFEYALKALKPELKVCHTHHGGLNMDWWGSSKPPWPLNLISLSKWMQRYYASLGFGSRVVYNGIPIEEYGFKAEKGDRLLFVGRLDSFKRPHIAIEVAKKAGLGLDIAGGSFVYDTAYMESVKQACDGEQIKLYLDVPMEPKVKLYQNAKAVIFPSKMGEPFGLIVPEANACGTPVIASRDGAIPETIEEGVTGFVCDSIDEMVQAIGKVDQIKPEVCRERAERLFNREAMAKNYVEAYQDILRGDEW